MRHLLSLRKSALVTRDTSTQPLKYLSLHWAKEKKSHSFHSSIPAVAVFVAEVLPVSIDLLQAADPNPSNKSIQAASSSLSTGRCANPWCSTRAQQRHSRSQFTLWAIYRTVCRCWRQRVLIVMHKMESFPLHQLRIPTFHVIADKFDWFCTLPVWSKSDWLFKCRMILNFKDATFDLQTFSFSWFLPYFVQATDFHSSTDSRSQLTRKDIIRSWHKCPCLCSHCNVYIFLNHSSAFHKFEIQQKSALLSRFLLAPANNNNKTSVDCFQSVQKLTQQTFIVFL